MSSLYDGEWMPKGPGFEGCWIRVPRPGSNKGGVWMNIGFKDGSMSVGCITNSPELENVFREYVVKDE